MKSRSRFIQVFRAFAAVLALSVVGCALAQTTKLTDVTPMTPDLVRDFDPILPDADYIKRVEMVPMRDGVKLYTVIFMKKGTTNEPILISRTPYDAKGMTSRQKSQTLTEVLPVMDAEFVEDGYIRVYQDIRGMHHSQGEFVMTRPIVGVAGNTTGIDESTDTYDTLDWLVKNVHECNGKVGAIGSSYLGFTTLMCEINPHPALKAAVPQSPMVDGWMGDDFFHNGAYRNGGFDYGVGQGNDHGDGGGAEYGVGDQYEMYLREGSSGDHARKWHLDKSPFAQLILQNPAYTKVWSDVAVDKWMAKQELTVPTMLVVGQWDQEDSYGAPAVYRAWKPRDKNNILTLVIGPWRHSGVNHYGYALGDLTFTGDTAKEFRVRYLKPFFDHYLKDAPDPHMPAALTYATGINKWEESVKWPMGTLTPLYVDKNAACGFASASSAGHDDYTSDPAKPVPYLPRPVDGARNQWQTWLVHDQRFVDGRPDVLTYQSAMLDKPIHIMGAPLVDLFASTTGSDSDWVVKLIDVYPNTSPENDPQQTERTTPGEQIPIGIEIFRGRYVHGFATPGPLTPGKVEEYKWTLPNVNHVFLPGHKLMIQIQSTLFPLYDRNPQTYVQNIFNAKREDYQPATQSIFHGGKTSSAVFLPIVKD